MSDVGVRLRTWWRGLKRDHMSLRLQLVALTGLLATVVAVGQVVVVQWSLAGAARSTTERVVSERADEVIAAAGTASLGATLVVPSGQVGPGITVYDDTGRVVAGTVPGSMQELFDDISVATSDRMVVARKGFTTLARPFTIPSGASGVVVVIEPLAPYERGEEAALVVSIAAGALLVLTATGSAMWISKRVLSPVRAMARTADEWSEHHLDRRFALGPPTNEIRALGHTLDGLLEKVAQVITSEQRLTSELAHELRTPLTTINGAGQLLALRDDLDSEGQEDIALILKASEAMSATITDLLDISRREHPNARARTSAADLEAGLRQLPLASGDLRIDIPSDLFLDVPQTLALRALAPVVENALRASERVSVIARLRGRDVDILVVDQGPGVPDGWVDTLFTPGWSGTGGSGLGLSLARRVARTGGGDVALLDQHNPEGGATFVVTFPGGHLEH